MHQNSSIDFLAQHRIHHHPHTDRSGLQGLGDGLNWQLQPAIKRGAEPRDIALLDLPQGMMTTATLSVQHRPRGPAFRRGAVSFCCHLTTHEAYSPAPNACVHAMHAPGLAPWTTQDSRGTHTIWGAKSNGISSHPELVFEVLVKKALLGWY